MGESQVGLSIAAPGPATASADDIVAMGPPKIFETPDKKTKLKTTKKKTIPSPPKLAAPKARARTLCWEPWWDDMGDKFKITTASTTNPRTYLQAHYAGDPPLVFRLVVEVSAAQRKDHEDVIRFIHDALLPGRLTKTKAREPRATFLR